MRVSLGISTSLNELPYIALIGTVLTDAMGVNCAVSLRHAICGRKKVRIPRFIMVGVLWVVMVKGVNVSTRRSAI